MKLACERFNLWSADTSTISHSCTVGYHCCLQMLEEEYANFTNQSWFTHHEKYFSGLERQLSFVALEEY